MAKHARTHKHTSLVLIGCGNLAWHLASQFSKTKQFEITVVNHRANSNLDDFRLKLKTKVVIGLENIPVNAEYYIVCVSDSALPEVIDCLRPANSKAVVMHTSGSTGIDIFAKLICYCGVLYPLQSFSKSTVVNWSNTPLLIEGREPMAFRQIKGLATYLTSKVITANSAKRLHLHLAAVLVNNFTNALFTAADEHLQAKGYKKDFALLEGIIQTGVDKIKHVSPKAAQTGPAKRNDKKTMLKHLHLLKHEKQVKKVYKEMSKLIRTQQDGRT